MEKLATGTTKTPAHRPARPALQDELHRTKPDVVVYCPRGTQDTDNEHFLVVPAPGDHGLLAFWTQSSCEGYGDNKIMMARSRDGAAWDPPITLVGHRHAQGRLLQASWAVPIVNARGRIYCLYVKEDLRCDLNRSTTGHMGCMVSDDGGHTWADGGTIHMPRDRFDHPDAAVPKNWIAWQLPIRDRRGRVFLGYTQWTSPQVCDKQPDGWYSRDSRCKFVRFENIDESPDPEQLRLTWLPDDERGIEVAYPGHNDVSVAQEPSVALLPDGRLFCVLRTFTGFIWYSVSDDDGHSWRRSEPLRYRDGGDPVKQPIAPCPLYAVDRDRFLLLFHNNDGNLGVHRPGDALHNRRPAFISMGRYLPEAHQPIWFDEPVQILDTDGVTVGPKGTAEVATYTSLTQWRGRTTLWYPDRKYFLLGKHLTEDMRV